MPSISRYATYPARTINYDTYRGYACDSVTLVLNDKTLLRVIACESGNVWVSIYEDKEEADTIREKQGYEKLTPERWIKFVKLRVDKTTLFLLMSLSKIIEELKDEILHKY